MLSADQKKIIEENRKKALQIKAEKAKKAPPYTSPSGSSDERGRGRVLASIFDKAALKRSINAKSQDLKREDDKRISLKFISSAEPSSVEERFEVRCCYHPKLVELFKMVPTRSYNAETKKWSFAKSQAAFLKKVLKPHSSIFSVEDDFLASQKCISHEDEGKRKVNANFVLISSTRFKVQMKYHMKSVNLFKQTQTRMYDAQNKVWTFDLSAHDSLVKSLHTLNAEVSAHPLSPNILKILLEKPAITNIFDHKELDYSQKVDSKLYDALLPFQKEGLSIGVKREGRLLLADDMGLGKTLQALAISCYFQSDWPLLIVCPSSIRYNWANCIEIWLPNTVFIDEIFVIDNSKLDGDMLKTAQKCKILIISYDLLVRVAKVDGIKEELLLKCRSLILDESHMIKSYKAARTKSLLPIIKNAKRILLLSGTPALSRPVELYTQIAAICPNLFVNYHEFCLRYCSATETPWGWDYSGASHMEELNILLQHSVMLRRVKSEVMEQLPSKQRCFIILDPSLLKMTNVSFKDKSSQFLTNQSEKVKKGLLLEFFRETCSAKQDAVCVYVKELVESDKKFIIFSHHKSMLDAISSVLQKHSSSFSFIRIDGSISSLRRAELCDKFQSDENCRAAILSITAASTGITLTSCDLVIFAELFWNPGILLQAEDRVHRIGQKKSVTINYLIARKTSDDYIWPLINQKLKVLQKTGISDVMLNTCETKNFYDPAQKKIYDYFENALNDENFEICLENSSDTESCVAINEKEPNSSKRKYLEWEE